MKTTILAACVASAFCANAAHADTWKCAEREIFANSMAATLAVDVYTMARKLLAVEGEFPGYRQSILRLKADDLGDILRYDQTDNASAAEIAWYSDDAARIYRFLIAGDFSYTARNLLSVKLAEGEARAKRDGALADAAIAYLTLHSEKLDAGFAVDAFAVAAKFSAVPVAPYPPRRCAY